MTNTKLVTTRQINMTTIEPLCRELSELGIEFEHHEMCFKAAGETPEYIQIIASVLTWSNVFKLAATAFFAELGKEAAKDLWKNKLLVAQAILNPVVAPIKKIAAYLFEIQNKSALNSEIVFTIPIPDDLYGASIKFRAESELDVSIYLACFSLKTEAISSIILEFEARTNASLINVELKLQDNGQFYVKLQDFMKGYTETYVV